MEEYNKKKKRRLRLTIFNEHTFEEVKSMKVSRPLMFSLIGGGILIVFVLVILLFIYTPLNLLIPSKIGVETKNNSIENSLMIDSLEKKIISEKIYLNNLKNIIRGKVVTDTFKVNKIYTDTSIVISKADTESSNIENIIKAELESDKTGINSTSNETIKKTLSNLHFILPLKGIISNKFEREKSHFGIDIVPENNETVFATLSGTVILSTWSVETGYIIGIQHDFNLISFYKHNSVLLKKEGDKVKSGESIAIVGNSGEQTTGPHLHFELWHNGIPTDPTEYLSF